MALEPFTLPTTRAVTEPHTFLLELEAHLASTGAAHRPNTTTAAVHISGIGLVRKSALLDALLANHYMVPDQAAGANTNNYLKHLNHFRAAVAAYGFPGLPLVCGTASLPLYDFHIPKLLRLSPGLGPANVVYIEGPYTKIAPGTGTLAAAFSGLSFVSRTDLANLIGYAIAMFARPSEPGWPLLVLDSACKSSGKSTTAAALGYLLTGREVPMLTYTGEEAELEKRLGALADRPGPAFVCIDNIRGKKGQGHNVRSQALAAMSTASHVQVRGVYRDPAPLAMPIVVLTMNNARVEPDLADRIIRVSLTRSFESVGHARLDPHPLSYVREHRASILHEIVTILETVSIHADYATAARSRFYRFEAVARAGAAALGFAVDYGISQMSEADAFAQELVALLVQNFRDGIEIAGLVNAVEHEAGLRELNAYLDLYHGPKSGRPSYLASKIKTILAVPVKYAGRVYRFKLVDNVLSSELSKEPQ